MKFAAIADWADQDEYPVAFMCEQLEVSRSGYYAWRGAPPSARATLDELLTALIVSISQAARGNPGVRRVRAGLAQPGFPRSARTRGGRAPCLAQAGPSVDARC